MNRCRGALRAPAFATLALLVGLLSTGAAAQGTDARRITAPGSDAPGSSAPESIGTVVDPMPKTNGYLKLHKRWINAIVGDAVSITATSSGTTNTSSIASTANTANETDNATNYINLVIGSTVTLPAETFTTGSQSNYTTTVACVNATVGSSTPPTTYLNPNAIVDCTYTNTRKSTTLKLVKTWVDAKVGDAVSFTATGLTNSATATLASTANTANESDNGTQVTVYAGEVATLAESFTTGSASNYDSVLACTGTTGLSGGTLTVKPGEGPIVCTYTNTHKKRNLTLKKTWVNANVGDQVTMTTTGLASNATITSAADTANETDTGATVSNLAGATVTLPAETFNSGSQANYVTTVSCTGVTPTGSTPPATFTMPEGDVVCTYTNTRRTSTLQLKKTWVDAKVGDAVSFTATGIVNAAGAALASTANTASETDSGSIVTVYAGEQAALGETFTTGSAANYSSGLGCTGTTGLSGSTLTVKPEEGPIVCTYTNTRPHGTIRLRKTWVNAAVGDTAAVSATGIQNAAGAALNSTADSASESDTGPAVTMYSGETALISELVNPSGNYTSSFQCAELPKAGGAKSVGDQFTMPNPPSDYVCTYTNTRKQRSLTLKKAWVNGINGDAITATTTGLANNASVSSTSTGNNTDTGNAVSNTPGATVTLPAEQFTTGSQANYTTTVACTGVTPGSSTPGPNATFTMPDGDVVCTYTNTRKSRSLTLKKTWVNGVNGDAITATTTGLANNASVTSTSTGNNTDTGSPVSNVPGATVTLPVEQFTTGLQVRYTTTVACTGATPADSTPGPNATFTMPDGDVVCTYTNTRRLRAVTLKKVWVNGIVGDAFTVTTTGLANNASVTSTSSGNNTDTGSAVSDTPGATVTLPVEQFTSGSAANYTSTVGCLGATLGSTTPGPNATFTMPDEDVLCTYTNARKVVTLQLKKTWITALVGNTVTLSASGFANGAAAGFDSTAQTANETDEGAVVNVFAGETGTLSEGSIGGPTGGTWQSGLSCVGNANPLVGNALTVSANDSSIVCTFTNQRFPPAPPPPRTPPTTVPVGTPEGLALLAALLALMGAWSTRRRLRK